MIELRSVACAALALAASSCSADHRVEESTSSTSAALDPVTAFGTNPGNLLMFDYVPSGMPSKAPLVLALHGCTQTATDYESAGWNALADTYKFYVVYPQQQSTNNTDLPATAAEAARFDAVVVLPSPSLALVIKTTRTSVSILANSRLVRIKRYASAAAEPRANTGTSREPDGKSWNDGTVPRIGLFAIRINSSTERIPSSRYSKMSTRVAPNISPIIPARAPFRAGCGLI